MSAWLVCIIYYVLVFDSYYLSGFWAEECTIVTKYKEDRDIMSIFKMLALLEGVKLIATDDKSLCGKANCHSCIHSRDVPGNAHIRCEKPWHRMSGYRHGIEKGWFMYPQLFDPVWMTTDCPNFEEKAKGKSFGQSSGKSM